MKNQSLLSITIAMSLCLISTSVFAFSYGKLHVQISNGTGSVCQLSNQVLHHGRFDNAPPQTILASDSKTFDMNETISWYGPDAVLSYQCGAGNITFEVQQNSSIFRGHTPKVTVVSSYGLALTSHNQSSSLPYNARGIANIVIEKD